MSKEDKRVAGQLLRIAKSLVGRVKYSPQVQDFENELTRLKKDLDNGLKYLKKALDSNETDDAAKLVKECRRILKKTEAIFKHGDLSLDRLEISIHNERQLRLEVGN